MVLLAWAATVMEFPSRRKRGREERGGEKEKEKGKERERLKESDGEGDGKGTGDRCWPKGLPL